MTYDGPYRVTRARRIHNGFEHTVVTYAIERSGEDTVCTCTDVTYAYRLADLLNEEHREKSSPANDRCVHQDGTKPLARAAD